MLAGTAIGGGGLVAAAAAPSKWVLLASLFVFGIGSAAVPVAGAGALFVAYGPGRRGWALGVRQTAVPLGGAIAAITFPPLYALAGAAPTLLFTAAAVVATGVWFALVVGDARGPARGETERPFRSIWRADGMQRLLLVAACYIVVLQALLTYIVPSVRDAGYSELTAGVAYFAINVAAMLARIAWGRVADRHGGTRRVRTLVEVGLVAAVGGLLFALALHVGPFAVIPAAVLFGVGALGWNALVYVSAGERAAPELAGRSVAVAATVVFVLSGLVTPLLGALADTAGWNALWVTTAAVALVGALLAGRLPRAAVAAGA